MAAEGSAKHQKFITETNFHQSERWPLTPHWSHGKVSWEILDRHTARRFQVPVPILECQIPPTHTKTHPSARNQPTLAHTCSLTDIFTQKHRCAQLTHPHTLPNSRTH